MLQMKFIEPSYAILIHPSATVSTTTTTVRPFDFDSMMWKKWCTHEPNYVSVRIDMDSPRGYKVFPP